MNLVRSPSWSTTTPHELRRELPSGGEQVVGYYSEKPEEADLPGYSVVKRTEAPTSPKKKRTQGA